jgi:two-component system, NtrC family, nitrogen regulation sensor histidine kinase NtrY
MTAPRFDPPPSDPPSAADDRWPLGWVASASIALLALAAWQRSPGWVLLAVAGAATVAAAWTGRHVRRPRFWAFSATVLLALALVFATVSTLGLDRIARDWSRWSSVEREDRATRVAAKVTTTSEQLLQAAAEVANDPARLSELAAGVSTTTRPLSPPLDARIESALLVFRGDRLVARAGQVRTRVAAHGAPGVRLVDEPFYASLVARAVAPDGSMEVVAVALVSAIPPADRFARALTQTLADPVDIRRTLIESPDSARVADGETVIVVTSGSVRLARVRALARTEGETQLALLQQARARTAVPLALAALVLLVAAWRRPARTVHRLGVAITLWIALAVAPLSALSNVSPLFDASSYFAAMGGPWTANVAALLLSTGLGLAMLFLSLRSGRVTRVTSARWLAAGVVLVSATLGPFVLRDLARGIKLPADRVSLSLWIAWQLSIALAGVCVLHAGAAAGRSVLGNRRGLPPMMAPLLAIGAAVLAPVLWKAPGGWPAWYPVCWALAIGALALTRRGVALVTGAAVIAGAGATTLTWGATVRARMNLAQYDLARLSSVDRDASQLLARFAGDLSAELSVGDTTRDVMSRDRLTADALLRRYAASELAQAGYPARIARWDVSSTDAPATMISLVPVEDTIGAQSIIATIARESGVVEIRAVEDGPTTILVAAVPSTGGRVTTIAVPPRTRLLPTDPFASLTGVAGARAVESDAATSCTATVWRPGAVTLVRCTSRWSCAVSISCWPVAHCSCCWTLPSSWFCGEPAPWPTARSAAGFASDARDCGDPIARG